MVLKLYVAVTFFRSTMMSGIIRAASIGPASDKTIETARMMMQMIKKINNDRLLQKNTAAAELACMPSLSKKVSTAKDDSLPDKDCNDTESGQTENILNEIGGAKAGGALIRTKTGIASKSTMNFSINPQNGELIEHQDKQQSGLGVSLFNLLHKGTMLTRNKIIIYPMTVFCIVSFLSIMYCLYNKNMHLLGIIVMIPLLFYLLCIVHYKCPKNYTNTYLPISLF